MESLEGKTIVRVAWDSKSSNLAAEEGWDTLVKESQKEENRDKYSFDEIPFDTEAEAKAYMKGIADGNGWDEPYYELKK